MGFLKKYYEDLNTTLIWGVNVTIATVILGVTSFGLVFYVFIIIAGTISEDCPYQTPGARTFRYILPALRPVPTQFSKSIRKSWSYRSPVECWSESCPPWYSVDNITFTLLFPFTWFVVALVHDVYRLGRGTPRLLIAVSKTTYHQLLAVRRWFKGSSPLKRKV
jgi:hypothetical protein